MTYIKEMAYINTSPGKVWGTLEKSAKFQGWMSNLGKIIEPMQKFEGTGFVQEFKIVGNWKPRIAWKPTKIEHPHSVIFEGYGTALSKAIMEVNFEQVQEGTQFKVSLSLKYKWFAKICAWVLLERLYLRRTMETRLRKTVDAAKTLAEGRQVSGSY